MIKITELSHIKGVEEQLADYIRNKVRNLTEEYQVQTIEEFGAIFVIESENDLVDYKEMGFYKEISFDDAEYISNFLISSDDRISERAVAYTEACFVFSDGYCIIIIGRASFFKDVCQ